MGERNGSATDSIVGIDAFEVFSAPSQPAPVVLTPTPPPYGGPHAAAPADGHAHAVIAARGLGD